MPLRQNRSFGIGNVSFLVNVKVVNDIGRKAVDCPADIDANVDVGSVEDDGTRDALARINTVLRRHQITRKAARYEHSLIDERSKGFDSGRITATNDAKTNASARAIVKHDRPANHGEITIQRQQVVVKCSLELGSVVAQKVARRIRHPAGIRLVGGGRSRAAHGSIAIAEMRARGHTVLAVHAIRVHVKVVGTVLIEATEAGIDSNLVKGSRQ